MQTEYIQGFIHDFRSSLGLITGYLDPEASAMKKENPNFDPVTVAKCQAEKALKLLVELEKSLTGPDTETVATAPVTATLINSLMDEFVTLYPNVKVRFTCPKTITIHTDLSILRRVIDNCISNAFKAGKAPWVLLTAEGDADVMLLHVKDGGVGMDKRQLERLGLGFSTTGGGSGTRILISLLIRAGGVARWESIPDVGTCVTLTFPALVAKNAN